MNVMIPLIMFVTNISLIIMSILARSFYNITQTDIIVLSSQITVFSQYLGYVTGGLMMSVMVVVIYIRSKISAKRINEIIAEVPDIQKISEGLLIEGSSVEFKNISFKYGKDSEDVLTDISFKLKEGETATVEPGFHVLELAEPVKLTGNKFSVVLQIINTEGEKLIALESPVQGTSWQDAEVNPQESYWATEAGFEANYWTDLSTLEGYPGNLCIKAYTNEVEGEPEPVTLTEIYIEKAPNKTVYQEGENFDKTGMTVIAKYSDGSSHEVTNYDVIDGDNLQAGTTSITIRYTENGVTKETTQKITVNKKQVILTEIYIEQSPDKTIYQEGENFDKIGMKIIAKYSDGSSKEVTNYEIIGGENLQIGTQTITIRYTENGVTKETIQEITVNSEVEEVIVLTEIYIDKAPNKTEYEEGENFDKTGIKIIAKYSDGSSHEITDYEIIGGDNLQAGTKSITIRYTENGVIRSTTQEITVNEKENPEPSKEPVPSNFENAKAKIQEAKIYFNSNDLSILSGEITIKIDGIKIGDESNDYKHYYYLSGTQGDKEIETWKETEIKKEADGTYSITINIKSEDLENYDELIESDNLYLYIKEIASVEDKEIETINTLEVENEAEAKCYIDGEYVGGIDDVLNYNKDKENNDNQNNEDVTTAPGKLPYAGRTILIVITLVALIATATFAYHRYKNIDR